MLLLAIPVGLLVGLSLGALGGGGSILTVPALVYLLDQNAHGATTASLVIVGFSALAGSLAHARAGRVQVRSGLVFGLLGVAGSIGGSRLSAGIDTNVLLACFAVLVLIAAVAMGRRSWSLRRLFQQRSSSLVVAGPTLAPDLAEGCSASVGSDGPGMTVLSAPKRYGTTWANLRLVAAASVVGLITGFFGVGGGFVVVPALVLALGLEMPVAVGTSLLVIAINSASGLLARIGTHPDLDWSLVLVFVVAAVGGSFLGTRVVGHTRPERLGLAFSVLLLAVSAYTAARSVPHVL